MTEIAIHYRQQFFGETTKVVPSSAARAGIPRGLVGRQVANAEMLSALLRYGSDKRIQFLVGGDGDSQSLHSLLKTQLPSDKQAVITPQASLVKWMKKSSRCCLWEPQPPTASMVWTRNRYAPNTFAIGGVTHALCSAQAVATIRDLVLAPVRNFDRLVCTSESVAHTARVLIDHYGALMGKTNDAEMIQLETIPLGVDCERHRPATRDERKAARARLVIPDDADVVLFVGRLSHHAKSNPLPMYAACQRAAQRNGRAVVLILAGWYASPAIEQAFQSEAARVAPDVSLVHVDAMDPQWRDSIWAAADVFVSLADSIQETFGLTVVEAMSRRLPVIASDWNGYRESIQHERTGLLVPTTMIRGAGEQALLEMHEGRLSYDHFLAAIGQTISVSTRAACDAIEQLLCSVEQRNHLAEQGYHHARTYYAWPRIIARMERLWFEQRSLMLQQSNVPRVPSVSVPPREIPTEPVPSICQMFDRYPSAWISMDDPLVAGSQELGTADQLLASPLANHSGKWRASDPTIQQIVDQVSLGENDHQTWTIRALQDRFSEASKSASIDSVAWAMKYGLLAPDIEPTLTPISGPRLIDVAKPDITFTTTCMGRLSHLKQTLPRLVSQPGCHVVVADFSCPDQCGRWIRENYSPQQVTVVNVHGRTVFDRSQAKNAAISGATTPWVCVIDADIVVADNFAQEIRRRLFPGRFLRRLSTSHGVGGTFVASRRELVAVGMHDPTFQGWGEQDFDVFDALRFIGQQAGAFPEELIGHLDHDDEMRTRFHETTDRRVSHLVNRMYRQAKWDVAKLQGEVPDFKMRRRIYDSIQEQVFRATRERSSAIITIPLGRTRWNNLQATGSRTLRYRVNIDSDS